MAQDINHVMIIGRLTRDLGSDEKNFGYVGNGQARANVSIAVNRSKKNGDQWIEEVNYFNLTIWGKTAENLKPYLTKGKQICVEGHLKQDRWKDKEGKNQSRISIVADNVQLLGGKTDGGQSSGAPTFKPAENNSVESNSYSGEEGDFPEDIPF